MRNKFNYNTRECQTINNIVREKGLSTEPPPSDTIRGNITLWEIFDVYFAEELAKQEEKEGKKKKSDQEQEKNKESSLYSTSFKRCLKIMERMVMQNEQAEKYEDYKYWWSKDGENLEAGKTEGSLLPIWRFSNEKLRKKNVTSITWNPKYADLFGLSLGSYDFLK